MTIIMSDAFTVNVLYEHYWQLIDNSRSVIGDSIVMLQLVASFTIVINNHFISILQATGITIFQPRLLFI